jgi:hypothetical protein
MCNILVGAGISSVSVAGMSSIGVAGMSSIVRGEKAMSSIGLRTKSSEAMEPGEQRSALSPMR